MLKLLLTEVQTCLSLFEGMEDNPYMQERAADIRGRAEAAHENELRPVPSHGRAMSC